MKGISLKNPHKKVSSLSNSAESDRREVPSKKRQFLSYLDVPNVSPRVKIICEIITKTSLQDVGSVLAASGVEPSEELVEEVLKLSYGSPAATVKFFRWAGLTCKHSVYAWNLMVDLLGKNQCFEEMWDAIRSMRQENVLSLATFVSVFGSYCVAGRFTEAVMTFDVMEKYGIQPDIVAVNSLLSAICQEENQMAKAAEIFEKTNSKIAPDGDTFAILLEGWEKEGNAAKAKRTFGEMVIRVGWSPENTPAYDAFLTTIVRASQTEEALKFLQVMKKNNCLPGLKFFSSAIDSLVKENDSKHAVLFWDVLLESGLVPNLRMYNAIIGLVCINDEIENAFRFLDEMVFYGAFPDSLTYNTIFHCLINLKKVHQTAKFFNEMVKNEFPPTHSNCAIAIGMLFDGDDPETAIEIWDYMMENHISPLDESANALLIGLCNMNRLTEVKRFVNDMIDRRINIYESTMRKLKNAFYKEGRSSRDTYDSLSRRWKESWRLR